MTASEKVTAQAIPVIGSAAGAVIDRIFMSHHQEMARGHFVVRRLERKYGAPLVHANYEHMSTD